MSQLDLSIVIPCLNEERTIGACIREAHEFLSSSGLRGEVLVVDNGSSDESIRVSTNCGARVISCQKQGYGASVQHGIAQALGEYIAMGDGDLSYNFCELSPLISKLQEGADLVIGNRFEGGIERGAMPFLHRYVGNPALSLLGRVFFSTGISDIYCGIRAFRRDSIQRLHLTAVGMEFAVEMVIAAARSGLRIEEVPVSLRRDGRDRHPHLRTFRDGFRTLRQFVHSYFS